jgi:hypothetical protein
VFFVYFAAVMALALAISACAMRMLANILDGQESTDRLKSLQLQ